MEHSAYNVALTDVADDAVRTEVKGQIKAFNDVRSPFQREIRGIGAQPLDIVVLETNGRLVGALIGDTYWGWLHIDNLWLDAAVRG